MTINKGENIGNKSSYQKVLNTYIFANEILGDEINLAYLNYGYAYLDPDLQEKAKSQIQPEDIDLKYHIYLYLHLANAVELENKRVLEVGCGRGGGASSVMKYRHPQKLVGLDLCTQSIEFANKHFAKENLFFQQGNAEYLSYEANSFDAVINVESAHLYPNKTKFINEVYRVLSTGGYFLFADIGRAEILSAYVPEIEKIGFKIIQYKNITANVLRSLQLDSDRKKHLFLKVTNNDQKKYEWLANKSNLVGTKGYKLLSDGTKQYWSYIFQKN